MGFFFPPLLLSFLSFFNWEDLDILPGIYDSSGHSAHTPTPKKKEKMKGNKKPLLEISSGQVIPEAGHLAHLDFRFISAVRVSLPLIQWLFSGQESSVAEE